MKSIVKNRIQFTKLSTLISGFCFALHVSGATANEKSDTAAIPEGPVAETWQTNVQNFASGLPNPLSLKYLLQEFPLKSPSADYARAQWALSKANAQALNSTNGVRLDLEGRLGQREFADESQKYNLAALHLGKVLYDGNQNESLQESLWTLVDAEELRFVNQQQANKLKVMEAYFDAILADFQFRIDNEAMAVEYIAFDKTKDRHALGRLSDVDLLSAENQYQKSLLNRNRSEQDLLKKRLYLANTVGYSDLRPDKLAFPDLSGFNQRDPKELKVDVLQQQIENNPVLIALKTQWQAQLQQVEVARQLNAPSLRADAWVGHLSDYPEIREGKWRAELGMSMPLYDSGVQKAEVAKERARLVTIRNQYEVLAQQLREQVTDIYFQIQLLKSEGEVHQLFGDYADLYLDFSRALYENESATDLGDSMVRLSQANYNQVEWQFKKALLWAQLDYLLGKPLVLAEKKSDVKEGSNGGEQ